VTTITPVKPKHDRQSHGSIAIPPCHLCPDIARRNNGSIAAVPAMTRIWPASQRAKPKGFHRNRRAHHNRGAQRSLVEQGKIDPKRNHRRLHHRKLPSNPHSDTRWWRAVHHRTPSWPPASTRPERPSRAASQLTHGRLSKAKGRFKPANHPALFQAMSQTPTAPPPWAVVPPTPP